MRGDLIANFVGFGAVPVGLLLSAHRKHFDTKLRDFRRHPRVVPKNPMATILLADGSLTSCLVIDFSDSGVAVSADLYPELGTPLAVGKMVGRVVRRFAEGFAVEFAEKASLADIERLLASTEPRSLSPRAQARQ